MEELPAKMQETVQLTLYVEQTPAHTGEKPRIPSPMSCRVEIPMNLIDTMTEMHVCDEKGMYQLFNGNQAMAEIYTHIEVMYLRPLMLRFIVKQMGVALDAIESCNTNRDTAILLTRAAQLARRGQKYYLRAVTTVFCTDFLTDEVSQLKSHGVIPPDLQSPFSSAPPVSFLTSNGSCIDGQSACRPSGPNPSDPARPDLAPHNPDLFGLANRHALNAPSFHGSLHSTPFNSQFLSGQPPDLRPSHGQANIGPFSTVTGILPQRQIQHRTSNNGRPHNRRAPHAHPSCRQYPYARPNNAQVIPAQPRCAQNTHQQPPQARRGGAHSPHAYPPNGQQPHAQPTIEQRLYTQSRRTQPPYTQSWVTQTHFQPFQGQPSWGGIPGGQALRAQAPTESASSIMLPHVTHSPVPTITGSSPHQQSGHEQPSNFPAQSWTAPQDTTPSEPLASSAQSNDGSSDKETLPEAS